VNLLGNDDEAVAAWWHHISLTEIRHCRMARVARELTWLSRAWLPLDSPPRR